jgi:hypothetical protein
VIPSFAGQLLRRVGGFYAGFFGAGIAKVKPNGRFFYFAYCRNFPLKSGSRSQIWLLEPDIAYAFPNDGDITLVASMPQRAKLSKWKADPEAAIQRLFDSLPNGPELGRGERVSPMMGVVEYPNLIRKTFTRGLALIGDRPFPSIRCGASALRLGLPIGRMAGRGRRRTWQTPSALGSWPCGLRPAAQT